MVSVRLRPFVIGVVVAGHAGCATVAPPVPPEPLTRAATAAPPPAATVPAAPPAPRGSEPRGDVPVPRAPEPLAPDRPAASERLADRPPHPPAPGARPEVPPDSASARPTEGAERRVEQLEQAARADPGNPHARLALATALAARDDRAGAIAELREALRLLEDARASESDHARAEAYVQAGQALIAHGDMARAVTVLRQALGIDPHLVAARTSLGLALHGMGHMDAAIDELRAVLRQQPDATSARLGLAAALIARQDWAGARAAVEEVLTHDPDALQAHASLGIVRYAAGDLPGAIEAYRRVLAQEPGHHDGRYGLGLMLKLARRDAEATREFLAAARGGVPRAQYFVGGAFAAGAGVERDLATAIAWWFRAAEQGIAEAEASLAELRQTALGKGRRTPAERQGVARAFRDFRAGLWNDFPWLVRNGDESVGAALLRHGSVSDAVTVLIQEGLALSEPAQELLEKVYADGVGGQLRVHDPRILRYFRMAAADGEVRPRLALARIYARGLGVRQDLAAAVNLLRGTPHEDAQRLLHELSAASRPAPPRP